MQNGDEPGLVLNMSSVAGKIGFGFGKNINLSYRFLLNKDSFFSTRRDQFRISTKIYNNVTYPLNNCREFWREYGLILLHLAAH